MESIRSMHLLVNPKSGRGMGRALYQLAAQVCEERGVRLVTYPIERPSQISSVTHQAAKGAQADNGVLVAAGGDGTLRAVAEIARETPSVRLAVIPCGTFNFFARTHKIPEDHEEALRNALDGEVALVRVGRVNGRLFLINAGLGLYVNVIRRREAAVYRFGRRRLVVVLSSIASFLRGHRHLMDIQLSDCQGARRIHTPMIFIGNNALQLRNLSLEVAACMTENSLAVLSLRPLRFRDVLSVILRGASKTIDAAKSVVSFCADSIVIHASNPKVEVALDGELFQLEAPLHLDAVPGAVRLMRPSQVKGEVGTEDLIPRKMRTADHTAENREAQRS